MFEFSIILFMLIPVISTFALVGLVFFLAFRIKSQQPDRCTAQTQGQVAGYWRFKDSKYQPYFSYEVDGRSYTVPMQYALVKYLPSLNGETYLSGDPLGQTITIHWPRQNLQRQNPFLTHFPVGMTATIYYDPADPATAYAIRPISRQFQSRLLRWIFIGLGIFFLVIVLLVAVVVFLANG